MRTKSRTMNFLKDLPVKVSDLKPGETVIDDTGIYSRVGNQILYKAFSTSIVFPATGWLLGESVQSTEQPVWQYGESVLIAT